MSRKIIVSVAPVSHVGKVVPKEARNPLTDREVAEETLRCADAGASMVHLHVRDQTGEQVADLSVFASTLDRIRERSEIIIQGSTGGVSTLSLDERCRCLDEPRVEIASLNMGSVNFGESVYINTLPDIRYWAARMRERGVAPELEIFNPSMIETSYLLREEGVLQDPLRFCFALGFHSSLAAEPRHLEYLASMLQGRYDWGFIHEGMVDLSVVTAALGLGATVLRVGYEDGAWLAPGEPARSNGELVERLVALVQTAGFQVASPAEARSILDLPPLEA